jgi:hypothetical protein
MEEDGLPAEVVTAVRAICLALPEAHEEAAWVGRRWRIRQRTFAHLFVVDDDSPPILARAAGDGPRPAIVLAFRAQGQELVALTNSGPPFVNAGWGRDAIGMVLDEATDWTEVRELLVESYAALAPKRLRAQLDRPD